MKVKTIKTRAGHIEFSIEGRGEPVLFIHGGHSNCKDTLPFKGLNPDKYTFITPSRPGYGRTPLNKYKTPEAAAGLIITLLDELNIEQVTVYGISAGGWTAIELAANYPDRIKKLILASAVSKKWLDKNEKTYKAAKIMFNPKTERFTWGLVHFFCKITPGLIAKSFLPEFSSFKEKNICQEEVKELTQSLRKYSSGNGFVNDIDQNISQESLSEIKCPTLIIHSRNDNSVPLSHALHANKLISSSRLHIVENKWGHMIWLGQEYKEIKEVIEEFLNK